MNIGTPPPRAQQYQSAQTATVAFANSIVDASLRLPVAPRQRALALEWLATHIDTYFLTREDKASEACAVLSAMLGTPVSADDLKDLKALAQRQPEYSHAMTAIVHASQRALNPPAISPERNVLRRAVPVPPGDGPAYALTPRDAPHLPPRVARKPVDMRPVSHLNAQDIMTIAHQPAWLAVEEQRGALAAPRGRRVITRPLRPAELERRANAQAAGSQAMTATVPVPPATPLASLTAPTRSEMLAAPSAPMPSFVGNAMQPGPLSSSVVAPPPYTAVANSLAGLEIERRHTPPPRRQAFAGDVRQVGRHAERHGRLAAQGLQASDAQSLASVASRVRLPPNGALPLALTDPKTRAPWVNPVFDTRWHVTCAGPAGSNTSLPENQISDYTLRQVMRAWNTHHNDPTALRQALQEALTCPISGQIFVTPVIAKDGYTYEESQILQWLGEHFRSPMTREKLDIETLSSAQVIRYLLRELSLTAAAPLPIAYADQRAKDKALSHVQAAPTILTNMSDVQRAAFFEAMKLNVEQATQQSGFGGDELGAMLANVTALCCSNARQDRAQGAQIIDSVIASHERFFNALYDRAPKSTMLQMVSDLYRMKKDYSKALQLFGDLSLPLFFTGGDFARIALLFVIRGQYTLAQFYTAQSEGYAEGLQCKHAALGELCRVRGDFVEALRHFGLSDSAEDVPLREVSKWRKLAKKRKTHRAEL